MEERRVLDSQLEGAARGLSYRTRQLAYVAILPIRPVLADLDEHARRVIANALVESSLANARALAYFFASKPRGSDAHFSHFDADWVGPVTPQTGRIIGVVSEYLAHASVRDWDDQSHPGAWPIQELAVTLAGEMSRFVDSLDLSSTTCDPTWFDPGPSETFNQLLRANPLASLEEPSENPKVGKLTEALRDYLLQQGLLGERA